MWMGCSACAAPITQRARVCRGALTPQRASTFEKRASGMESTYLVVSSMASRALLALVLGSTCNDVGAVRGAESPRLQA